MTAMSDYLEQQLVNHIFRTSSFAKPSTLAVALCTATVADEDTTLAGKEVANAGGYARQTRNPGDSNWNIVAASGGHEAQNAANIDFPQATGDWGTITYAAICNSATHNGGNMLFYGPLVVARSVQTGDIFRFSAGALKVRFS